MHLLTFLINLTEKCVILPEIFWLLLSQIIGNALQHISIKNPNLLFNILTLTTDFLSKTYS